MAKTIYEPHVGGWFYGINEVRQQLLMKYWPIRFVFKEDGAF